MNVIDLDLLTVFFSLSDMHNARSGMEVLVEMLNAIDPKNRQVFQG
jgi:hypothetical protein